MLAEFPWATVIRNERNLGFSGANNQGARIAKGRFLVLLNRHAALSVGLRPCWRSRAAGTGVVGARLLFPDNTIQHAAVSSRQLFGRSSFESVPLFVPRSRRRSVGHGASRIPNRWERYSDAARAVHRTRRFGRDLLEWVRTSITV